LQFSSNKSIQTQKIKIGTRDKAIEFFLCLRIYSTFCDNNKLEKKNIERVKNEQEEVKLRGNKKNFFSRFFLLNKIKVLLFIANIRLSAFKNFQFLLREVLLYRKL